MNKEILLLFFIAHLLAFFYFQTNHLSNKAKKYKDLLIHVVIYTFVSLLPYFILGFPNKLLLIGLLISLAHFIIDNIKYVLKQDKIYSKIKNNELFESILFFSEQFMYLIVILLAIYYLVESETNFQILSNIPLIDYYDTFKWILLIMLIMKPSNIIFKMLFGSYKPNIQASSEECNKNTRKAGAIIGSLERILMIICIAVGQYTTLGFIFTAKSVARYDKITRNSEFAEYYLLGTFSSILLTIIWYLVFFKWF